MCVGSGFHAGNASVNLTRESSSSPNLTKNLITKGMIIVFNNPVRVWTVIVFITPALHIGYINSRQSLTRTFSTSLCLRGLNFLITHLKYLGGTFGQCSQHSRDPIFGILSWGKSLLKSTLPLVSVSYICCSKKELWSAGQPKVVQLNAKCYFRFFPYNMKLSKIKLCSGLTKV